MARTLENLQKQYNSTAAASGGMGGPGGGRMAATNNFKGKPANVRGTLLRIFSYVARYWKRLILVVLCMLFSSGGSLIMGSCGNEEERNMLFNRLLMVAVPISVLICAAYNFAVAFIL